VARIRNISGEDRIVPWLGGRLVIDGAVVEVPDEDFEAYTCQESTWAPVSAPVVKDLTEMTLAELKEAAAARGIDFGDAKRKADVLAAIQAADATSDGAAVENPKE
jgi:hypothetical protein